MERTCGHHAAKLDDCRLIPETGLRPMLDGSVHELVPAFGQLFGDAIGAGRTELDEFGTGTANRVVRIARSRATDGEMTAFPERARLGAGDARQHHRSK